ncbi:LacI family DNA-binding transcriptional regulator [Saxibacter everestensis]|uniref:LacI family DNA-binding transcriptional regulator n=1 Tax=Saxibacter everestensis TaxID=2909229 RepID=A0ABY8QU93_9MICO|nr:LacI family DNA-binding transcriptional regulator [Brevibacteriaceae bacterium ZFBP1038]
MAADRDRSWSPPTISEVAAEAGVGRASAARTLGGYGYASPELRDRVLAAAEKLGYRTNALARSMSTGISHTLGVIVADIGNPFFAGVVRGISDTSRARGFDTIVLSTHEELDEEKAAIGVLVDKRVDGIIIASAALGRDAVDHITGTVDRGVPVVLLDRAIEHLNLASVVTDNREAARRAAELFIQNGHRRIGFIWGPATTEPVTTRRELSAATSNNLWSDGERLRGYLDALDDAGISFDPALVMTEEKTEENATHSVARMLDLPAPITAILCSETDATTGALRAVRASGLRYPDDVSIIGFDDSSWAAVMDPPLTMIEQPMLELGNRAAEILLDEIDGGNQTQLMHTLESRFIERSSVTGPPPLRSRNP